MSVFFLILLLIVIIFIAIGVSKPSNRRYMKGINHSIHYTGDYKDSNNCDSFGGDSGSCGGGD